MVSYDWKTMNMKQSCRIWQNGRRIRLNPAENHTGEFSHDDMHYFIFKTGMLSPWVTGVSGGYEEDSLVIHTAKWKNTTHPQPRGIASRCSEEFRDIGWNRQNSTKKTAVLNDLLSFVRCARWGSNSQPSASEANTLSSWATGTVSDRYSTIYVIIMPW